MVRLKEQKKPNRLNLIKFQFHYGTIKSKDADTATYLYFKFQFHYGTIKSSRLADNVVTAFLFQFHYGTIKSISGIV